MPADTNPTPPTELTAERPGQVTAPAPAPAPAPPQAAAKPESAKPEPPKSEPTRTEPPKPAPATGFIDMYGFVSSHRGWWMCGWIGRKGLAEPVGPVSVVATFEDGEVEGAAKIAVFERSDLEDRGVGVVIFADIEAPLDRMLVKVAVRIDGTDHSANAGGKARRLEPAPLVGELAPIVRQRLQEGQAKRDFSRKLERAFLGKDTIAALKTPLRLEIDEAIVCGPDGLLLIGWMAFAPGSIRRLSLRRGYQVHGIPPDDCVWFPRPDVMTGIGEQLGLSDPRCGFMAFVRTAPSADEDAYLELETAGGELAFKPFGLSPQRGLGAIKRILGDADVRHGELDPAFDKVLGPAISALNAERLASPAPSTVIEFGAVPNEPRCSVIVPLYGRIDYLEYQMALFSADDGYADVELIYVLDDPPRQRELENLAQSVFARFGLPFRLVLLRQNTGFAPANNAGLRTARGKFVCFLNSDAFPGTSGWIGRLCERLDADPSIGVIGPRLLFEDGAIQHEGCIYRTLKEFGGWTYVDHDNRGRLPGPERGVRIVPAITGACMVMERRLAEALGGFDEAFIIGDFEDSDLCKKVLKRGLKCAVDRDVELYHLERKSQAGSVQRWRQALTLYNAWVHQRRWYPNGGTAPAHAGAA